jgi:hypothetical protein
MLPQAWVFNVLSVSLISFSTAAALLPGFVSAVAQALSA